MSEQFELRKLDDEVGSEVAEDGSYHTMAEEEFHPVVELADEEHPVSQRTKQHNSVAVEMVDDDDEPESVEIIEDDDPLPEKKDEEASFIPAKNGKHNAQKPDSEVLKHKNPYSISWRWAIILLATGCKLFYIVHLTDSVLPSTVTIEEARENTKLFSGERSRQSLRKLVSFGPRVIGDDVNEIHVPQFIEDEIREAIRESHPSQMIHMERQVGSGAYQLAYKPNFTNIYVNVQNIIVKFDGSEGEHSVLVNCHYDSVSEVEGASDDGIVCAVMLELVRVLAVSNKRLKHNIVFLFNGAEESSLLASHLFMQHKWRDQCRVFINLEASGLGGRSILFQSGPKDSWLVNYYSRYAPHPHGHVLGEELFRSGYIPSDTDFRIFRDFGGMSGLDFAFSRNGHVYHTKYDNEKYIPSGCHQHMGDNILAMLMALGEAPELNDMKAHKEGSVVYYDYLGWFMIRYSAGGGVALNIFTIALAIFSIAIFVGRIMKWSWLPESTPLKGKKFEKITIPNLVDKFKPNSSQRSSRSVQQTLYIAPKQQNGTVNQNGKSFILIELAIAVGARILAMGVAIGFTVLIAVIVNAIAPLAMPWYSNLWLLFPLYWCPCIFAYTLVPHFFDIWRSKKHGLSLNTNAQMQLVASFVPWILIYFILTCAGIRMSSIFFIPILFTAISNLVIFLTPLYNMAHKWIWVYLAIQIPSILWSMYVVLLGYIAFAPVMGRSGVINGDVSIALLTAIHCIFLINIVAPFMTLIRRPGFVFLFLMVFNVIMIIIAVSTSVGLPYSSGPVNPRPQRYWIMHSLREFRNQNGTVRRSDSGYFVLNMDENSPHTIPPSKRQGLVSLAEECKTELYCGVPLFLTRMIPLAPQSSWIPSEPPLLPTNIELILKNGARRCEHNTCTFNFILKGPDRMTLTFVPEKGAKLVEWSVPSAIEASGTWKGQPSYFLNIVHGKFLKDYEIQLTFTVSNEQMAGGPILEIGLAGNHVHHVDRRTKAFHDLLNSLPDWTERWGWISAYKNYIF